MKRRGYKMKKQTQILAFLILLSPACKRSELELNDTTAIELPGSGGDITSARSIEEERAANKKRQADLDKTINSLKASLVNSSSLTAAEKLELEQKIAAAEKERTDLGAREKELTEKLEATENALNEARKRNEELKKELEKAKTDKKTEGNNGQGPDSVESIGPFTFVHVDYCMTIKDKSISEGADLAVEKCVPNAQQQHFIMDLADEVTGAYRIRNVASQKCLKIEFGSVDLGAKMIQSACNVADFSQQFYILGLNDTDFLLQSAKSQFCLNRQSDGTLTQVVCDSKLESNFQIAKPKP